MAMQPAPQPDPPEWPPAQTPERAEYLRRAMLATLQAVIDSMMADLVADSSTGDGSLADRTMLRLVRPYLPRMRGLVLARLAEADAASMERVMGALAVSVEQVLAEAPGEPLDRWRFVWLPGEPLPRMVPDVWTGERG